VRFKLHWFNLLSTCFTNKFAINSQPPRTRLNSDLGNSVATSMGEKKLVSIGVKTASLTVRHAVRLRMKLFQLAMEVHVVETDVFDFFNFSNFYISETELCILLNVCWVMVYLHKFEFWPHFNCDTVYRRNHSPFTSYIIWINRPYKNGRRVQTVVPGSQRQRLRLQCRLYAQSWRLQQFTPACVMLKGLLCLG